MSGADGQRIDLVVLTQAMLDSRGRWDHRDIIETVIQAAVRLSERGVRVTLEGAVFAPPRDDRGFVALEKLLADRMVLR